MRYPDKSNNFVNALDVGLNSKRVPYVRLPPDVVMPYMRPLEACIKLPYGLAPLTAELKSATFVYVEVEMTNLKIAPTEFAPP